MTGTYHIVSLIYFSQIIVFFCGLLGKFIQLSTWQWGWAYQIKPWTRLAQYYTVHITKYSSIWNNRQNNYLLNINVVKIQIENFKLLAGFFLLMFGKFWIRFFIESRIMKTIIKNSLFRSIFPPTQNEIFRNNLQL